MALQDVRDKFRRGSANAKQLVSERKLSIVSLNKSVLPVAETRKTVKRGRNGSKEITLPLEWLPDPAITLEETQKSFDQAMKIWREDQTRLMVLLALEYQKCKVSWKITKAVCLATGSFTALNHARNRQALLQLACCIDIARYLSPDVQIYAQDPVYHDLDKTFLLAQGVTPLEVVANEAPDLGAAVEHITPSTIVFEYFLSMNAMQLLEGLKACPAIYVGVQLWDLHLGGWQLPRNKPFVSAAKEMLAKYDTFCFPKSKDLHNFERLRVHWRMPPGWENNTNKT